MQLVSYFDIEETNFVERKSIKICLLLQIGYIAGVFCAIVSHPADTVVSKLNAYKGASAMDVVRKLGFAGLWGGLVPRIVMIGMSKTHFPISLIQTHFFVSSKINHFQVH